MAWEARMGLGIVGRRSLKRHVLEWFIGGEPILLITGVPGIGKTAFLNHIVSEGFSSEAPVGFHTCSTSDPATQDPLTFVQRASARIADSLPGFAAARDSVLGQILNAPINIRGTAIAENVSAQGMNIGVLVNLGDISIDEAMDRLLVQPLRIWHEAHRNERPVFVVDALDECLGYESRTSIPRIIASLSSRSPLRWLLSSRPDSRVLNLLASHRRVDMVADCPGDGGDVAEYVESNLADITLGDQAEKVARLAENIAFRASGNFLYASTICGELSGSSMQLESALDNPASLALPSVSIRKSRDGALAFTSAAGHLRHAGAGCVICGC